MFYVWSSDIENNYKVEIFNLSTEAFSRKEELKTRHNIPYMIGDEKALMDYCWENRLYVIVVNGLGLALSDTREVDDALILAPAEFHEDVILSKINV